MRLKNHLDPGLICVNLRPADKWSLLRLLSNRVAERVTGVDAGDLFRLLEERERKASTGVGKGVAIPHTTVNGLERTICLIAQIPDGVEFDAIDQKPVNVVFMLLSPSEAVWTHLRHLARISRIASNEDLIRQLIMALNPEAVVELVAREDDRHID